MIIYIGADHRGYKQKEVLKEYLKNIGYEVIDVGNNQFDENDDYPDFASKVAREVGADPLGRRGVLICGSGVGVAIVANKFKEIRAVLAVIPDVAYLSRNDDDTNVLCLGADLTDENTSKRILTTWLQTPFSGEERHLRRVKKIRELDNPQ